MKDRDERAVMSLHRVLLYVADVEKVVRFYEKHFGFNAIRDPADRLVELVHPDGGAHLMVHQLGKAQTPGQVLVKLVFDVKDVPAFCAKAAKEGLKFGTIHEADGYAFANAKDPAKNSISVSSRAFRTAGPG
jgi:catechol 2,3-dioxygenase-like lactoylglutathione lyase family enzyme